MVFGRTNFTKDTLFFLWQSLLQFTQDILCYLGKINMQNSAIRYNVIHRILHKIK